MHLRLLRIGSDRSPSVNVRTVTNINHEILTRLERLDAVCSGAAHGLQPGRLHAEVGGLVASFADALHQHNRDEERDVFPLLQDCGDPDVRQSTETLREDHAWIELCWLDIERNNAKALMPQFANLP